MEHEPHHESHKRHPVHRHLARVAQLSRDYRKLILGLGAAGGLLFAAGTVLLVKKPGQAPEPPAPASSPVPAQPQAAVAPAQAPAPRQEPIKATPPPAAKPSPEPARSTTTTATAPPADPILPPKPPPGPHVDVKRAMYNCTTEIGMLCNQFADKPWAAVQCLKKHTDSLLAPCAKSLEPVDSADAP